ncbi:hypothetical protein E6H12_03660 [Candidatus Bathyarchaeota archaeon]|nr:MAG: hypothetical protein E6H12_03660 [Candidatus Bathyarchaeota archaeon]
MISSALGGAILQSHYDSYSLHVPMSAAPASLDPLNVTGSPNAFNYSYSQANLYTGSSNPPLILPAPNATGTQFRWLSTVTRTTDNTLIPTSGFRFNITSPPPPSQGKQVVNWTLTIPQFNCKTCTSVQVIFDFFGNITRGTNATYALFNGTQAIQPSVTFTALGEFPPAATVSCPEIFCIPVTRYVGYKLTLSFTFAWNGTELPGMSADVGEIEVASIGDPIPSCVAPVSCHFMQQDQSNSSSIIHNTNLSSVSYNNTLTTHVQPGNVSTTRLWWDIEAINIYYPVGYNVTQIKLDNTIVYHALPEVPLEKDHCAPGTACAESLIALNITDFTPSGAIHNSTITIISTTPNSIRQLTTLSGGVPTRFFTSGDQIGIKILNNPSVVNASISQQTGQLNITFPQPLPIQTSPTTTLSGGVFSFNLPSDCGFNGELCARDWNVSAVFTSGFDLGIKSGLFRIDSLQVSFTGSTGGDNALSIQGRLTYGNGTKKASGVNATMFAIDTGTPVNTPVTNNQTKISSTLLYISNVTLVNGVFTQGQPLIMLFTVVDPDRTQLYNATIIIEHEWPGPQPHNMSVTFSLHPGDPLGDLPFGTSGPQTYKATILFTGTGVQVTLTNLRTSPNSETSTMTPGTSPVVPNRPHAGLFNLTLTSKIGNTTETPSSFIISPTYAYVSSSLVPSRYLSASNLIVTDPNGNFSATISSHFLLGAKNLVVFLLARDATGIGLVNNLSSIALTDSTILLSTTDSIGAVVKDQTVTATLHLTNNSTKITEVITVNLFIQGNGMLPQTLGTKTGLTLPPGESRTVTLTFLAPSTVGSYTLTFSSPEYGGPLTSQTLQVTILQSNLQILIPAAIGVVAAIIILGFYLVRRQPETAETEERTKPAGSKPKTPGTRNPPSKSLTRSQDPG